ncbi:hypothetical protein AOLI_G00233580 [Acnodon oligacanthus]
MKILMIFTLFWIAGPVSCFDVIGYTGGSILIFCRHKQHGVLPKYFCKETPKTCIETQNGEWVIEGRIFLNDSAEGLVVLHQNLSSQDAGSYECGEAGVWNHTLNLKVNPDPHCLGASTVIAHPGENATISCSYPEGLEDHAKLLINPDIRAVQSLKDRVSVSEDRSSRVLSVNISDVREDDGGVYYCVAVTEGTLLNYVFFCKEIQLQVIGNKTTDASEESQLGSSSKTGEEHFSSSIIVIIITVCICAALLLIGGSTLIFYKLRCKKTQNFADVSRQPDTHCVDEDDADYENVPANQNNISMEQIYQNI